MSQRRQLLPFRALVVAVVVVSSAWIVSGQQPRREWRDYGGGPASSRFVELTQITRSNVADLEVAWTYPHGQTGFNPVMARGVIYARGRGNALVALDAATGRELWVHDQVGGIAPRGINYWENADGSDRRLIFTINDYLQEIDAKTGRLVRTFGVNGAVDLREGLGRDPSTLGRVQSGTPGKVWQNLILLGSAPGEAYFSAPGDLRAFDVVTGKLVWQFHTVPHPGEFGYETWPKDAWKYIGGANTWGEVSIDAARGIAYFPTGSATFDYYGGDRVGQNLFANCLIALDARTGRRLWHFQNVHHDLWDFDNVSAPQLTTIRHDGRTVDVVAMAGKTGYLYVFDRVSGQPIWPIEERPVPTKTDVPGEVLWPTQPIPTNPPPFGRQTFGLDDINPYLLTDEQRASYRQRVAKARNDGQFTPIGFDEVVHMPGNHGGSNYGSTSADPRNGRVYVITFNVPALMRLLRTGEQPSAAGAGASIPGFTQYQTHCQACHGPMLQGSGSVPSLIGVASRVPAADLRAVIVNGRNQMPANHQLSDEDVNALMSLLALASGGATAGGPAADPPAAGVLVESGPAAVRPSSGGRGGGGGGGLMGAGDYPDGVSAPARLVMDGYGLHPDLINPPYTTLTGYDLNTGTIKWQIGLGDEPRLVARGIRGTGAANLGVKGSVVVTANGLLFVNAADQKVHVYDADSGKELHQLPLGAPTSGSPSMYEHGGRQYLLVTASGQTPAVKEAVYPTGPTGLVAYALKKR
ncbi:MAG: PQQ-binding-like beta-propeller repeat protein [Acidobacteria bacterium]|nr:PQQ-binding-like beta-propeller repeat protein [Acidobacteriota bacterium]